MGCCFGGSGGGGDASAREDRQQKKALLNDESSKKQFCQQCGAILPTSTHRVVRYCSQCGSSVRGSTVAAPEVIERVRRDLAQAGEEDCRIKHNNFAQLDQNYTAKGKSRPPPVPSRSMKPQKQDTDKAQRGGSAIPTRTLDPVHRSVPVKPTPYRASESTLDATKKGGGHHTTPVIALTDQPMPPSQGLLPEALLGKQYDGYSIVNTK